MSARKKLPKSYSDTIIEEELDTLGYNINWFRRASECIKVEEINTTSTETIIADVDRVYQYLFDKVLDSLTNCADLKMEQIAIKAIKNSQQIKRGIRKRKEGTTK